MSQKQTKIWLSLLVATLMVGGGVASFYAQQTTLYQGVFPLEQAEPAWFDIRRSSAVSVVHAADASENFAAGLSQKTPRSEPVSEEVPAEKGETQQAPKYAPNAPCAAGQKTIVKNAAVIACAELKNTLTLADIKKKTPKIFYGSK